MVTPNGVILPLSPFVDTVVGPKEIEAANGIVARVLAEKKLKDEKIAEMVVEDDGDAESLLGLCLRDDEERRYFAEHKKEIIAEYHENWKERVSALKLRKFADEMFAAGKSGETGAVDEVVRARVMLCGQQLLISLREMSPEKVCEGISRALRMMKETIAVGDAARIDEIDRNLGRLRALGSIALPKPVRDAGGDYFEFLFRYIVKQPVLGSWTIFLLVEELRKQREEAAAKAAATAETAEAAGVEDAGKKDEEEGASAATAAEGATTTTTTTNAAGATSADGSGSEKDVAGEIYQTGFNVLFEHAFDGRYSRRDVGPMDHSTLVHGESVKILLRRLINFEEKGGFPTAGVCGGSKKLIEAHIERISTLQDALYEIVVGGQPMQQKTVFIRVELVEALKEATNLVQTSERAIVLRRKMHQSMNHCERMPVKKSEE